MATIRKLDLDTAEYVIEKVIDAISATINNDIKYIKAPNGDIIGDRAKSTTEMFEEFSNKLVNILNEIKEIKGVK